MPHAIKTTRLAYVMELLGTNASVLARKSGADHSLISKWQRGSRPLSRRSKQLLPVAKALVALDAEGRLVKVLAPYRQQGEDAGAAMCEYLIGKDLPALPPRAEAPRLRTSGEYTVQYRVYMGQRGLRSAITTLLDYVSTLPPGREILLVSHGQNDWAVRHPGFIDECIGRLGKAFERGTKFMMVSHTGYAPAEMALFAGPWAYAHLKGYIRSRYCDDALPQGLRYAASIKGYLSMCAEADETAEDSLYTTMHTDPREIRRGEMICREYLEQSRPVVQYGFFVAPAGDEENLQLWGPGPLPGWDDGEAPDGSFCAICPVPGFGVMTREEYAQVVGNATQAPPLPEYLFAGHSGFANGPHRLILCREDVRDGLVKQRRQHEVLSEVLHRRAFVTREQMTAQLNRVLAAMDGRSDFEVALVPRAAFERISVALVSWRGSVTVGWLQEGGQSMFSADKGGSGSLYAYTGYVWSRLLAGWKRQDKVRRQLRKWLAGKELDKEEETSAIVRGWTVLPRD